MGKFSIIVFIASLIFSGIAYANPGIFSPTSIDTEEIHRLINEARVTNGLLELEYNDYLADLASEHTHYMQAQGDASHDNFGARFTLIHKNLGSTECAENVASGYGSPDQLVKGWLKSPEHYDNILNSNFSKTGIAFYKGYACQIFSD